MTDLPHPTGTASTSIGRIARDLRIAFVEARPAVQLVFLLRFVVGGTLSGSIGFLPASAVAGCASWMSAVWFVYLLNGVSDIAGDRQNSSSRPLASGALSPRFASNLCILLAAESLLTATLVSDEYVLLVASMLSLGMFYSVGSGAAKKSGVLALGVASLGTVLTYVAGAEATGGNVTPSLWSFALVAGAWIATAGHTKDLGDEQGDLKSGRRTLPIVLGLHRTRILISAATLLVGFVAALVALVVPGVSTLWLTVPGAVAVVFELNRTAQSGQAPGKAPYRTFMLVQYAVNLSTLIW